MNFSEMPQSIYMEFVAMLMWTLLRQRFFLQLIECKMISAITIRNFLPYLTIPQKRNICLDYSQNCHLICVFLRPQQQKDCVRWRKQVKGMLAARFALRLKKTDACILVFPLNWYAAELFGKYMKPCHLSPSREYSSQHEVRLCSSRICPLLRVQG
jgi:hypothetical protein